MNKDKALFYFKRYLRDLEEKAVFDHEDAAKRGMSYSERQKKLELSEKFKEEYEALSWIYERILDLKN